MVRGLSLFPRGPNIESPALPARGLCGDFRGWSSSWTLIRRVQSRGLNKRWRGDVRHELELGDRPLELLFFRL